MKKFTVLLSLAVLIFVITAGSSNSQTTKNKPFFQIDVVGGANIPLLDLQGNGPINVYQLTDYGASTNFSIAINSKIAVYTQKMLQLRLYALLGYAYFTNNNPSSINLTGPNIRNNRVQLGWPGTGNSQNYTPGSPSSERINIPYGGLGFEYCQYTDRDARSSFNFDFDVTLSLVNGRVYNSEANTYDDFNTFHSSPRLGFGVNAFWNYRLSPVVGINVGSRFQWTNMIGKSSSGTDEEAWMFLNDDTNGRNIAFVSFFGGMSFYFGKR